jgi:aldehyde oxidoreductase
LVTGDTDLTPDAGKMSALLQTFVSGAALRLAAEDLRRQVLCPVNADESSCFSIEAGSIKVRDGRSSIRYIYAVCLQWRVKAMSC